MGIIQFLHNPPPPPQKKKTNKQKNNSSPNWPQKQLICYSLITKVYFLALVILIGDTDLV